MVKEGKKFPDLVKNSQTLSNMVINGQTWSKIVKYIYIYIHTHLHNIHNFTNLNVIEIIYNFPLSYWRPCWKDRWDSLQPLLINSCRGHPIHPAIIWRTIWHLLHCVNHHWSLITYIKHSVNKGFGNQIMVKHGPTWSKMVKQSQK